MNSQNLDDEAIEQMIFWENQESKANRNQGQGQQAMRQRPMGFPIPPRLGRPSKNEEKQQLVPTQEFLKTFSDNIVEQNNHFAQKMNVGYQRGAANIHHPLHNKMFQRQQVLFNPQPEPKPHNFSFQNSTNDNSDISLPPPVFKNNFMPPPPQIKMPQFIPVSFSRQQIVSNPKQTVAQQPSYAQPKLVGDTNNHEDEYGTIQCPYCSDSIIRNFLQDHLEESCLQYIEHQFKQIDTVHECSICMENIKSDSRVLKCAHQFHNECIRDWLKKSKECPICRTEI